MVTNAPLELELEGVVYKFRALTFEDFEALELKMRSRAIQAARDAGIKTQEAMSYANKIDVFAELSTLQSPIVLVWMLQRMLATHHPQLTAAEIERWMRIPETRDKILPNLTLLAGLSDPSKNAESAAPPK
jgi:hypothetical protein